ncbi:MAG: single-stranded DNA-binding protein, partial [Cyanobacteria bacterium P01_F01_bin.86]
MAPFEAACVDQERIEQAEASYCAWVDWGTEDARAGILPGYANNAYLSGYIQAIKTRPLSPNGTIVWNMRSTTFHFHFNDILIQTANAQQERPSDKEKSIMFNATQLIGNLGADPEARYFESGSQVSHFTLYVNEKFNKDGQTEERTHRFPVEVWGKTAEFVNHYLRKGSRVAVQGSLA